jgi:cell pole-organizing protein PopZ
MRQSNEPSVEEILESIKKVIARDNRASSAAERRETSAPAPVPEAVSFHHVVEDEQDEILDLAELAEPAPEPLIAGNVVSSMRESLAALATMAAPGAAPQIVRSGETSLEGMVREMLRPMLADWLDKNLPPMVERLVAAEIARIVGKKV